MENYENRLEYIRKVMKRTRLESVSIATTISDEEIAWFKDRGFEVKRRPMGYVLFES